MDVVAPRRPRRTRLVALPAIALTLAVLASAVLASRRPAGGSKPQADYPHGDFQGDCSECHGDQGWKPARISRKFDHGRRTGFALAGAHATVGCTGCHASLDFTKQRRTCVACHQDPHLGELGTDCGRCHTARSFLDRAGMVRQHQLTRFPLVGAHAGLDCESCHPPAAQGHLRFVGVDPACRNCHVAGDVPDHHGFSGDCAQCHTTLSWQPARFDHAGTGFPLTCPHKPPVACVQCHGTPWTNAVPTDCVGCHRAVYDATTAPAHAAAGFPTACATCHDVRACGWTGASFDHDRFFPISSGRHSNIACSTCHVVPTDYTAFSCLTSGCHPQAATDASHSGRQGYAYVSSACYNCHPRGSSGG